MLPYFEGICYSASPAYQHPSKEKTMKPILSVTGLLAMTVLTLLPISASAQHIAAPKGQAFTGSKQPDFPVPTNHPMGAGLPDHFSPVMVGYPIGPGLPDRPAIVTHRVSSSNPKAISVRE
jgi:hypothetical protein